MKVAGRFAVLLCACALGGAPALGQGMVDPTQPPAESRQVQGAQMVEAPVSAGPQLQSILIGTRGREVAVIDGQIVQRGEMFNGALLVKVGKNQVVLRRGKETQVLTLFSAPEVDEQAALKRRGEKK